MKYQLSLYVCLEMKCIKNLILYEFSRTFHYLLILNNINYTYRHLY